MSRITGVVDATGAGAGRSPGEDNWTVVFALAAWRVDGGALQRAPLRVRKVVPEAETASIYKVIRPNTLVALDASLVGKDAADIETAKLAAILETPSDPELQAVVDELSKPVTFEDPVLGTLTLDRSLDWFVGEVAWMGETVRVSVEAVGDDLPDALRTAHALWNDQTGWQTRVRDYAVEKLLELKNGTWLGEDESPVSPDEFRARMTLESITVDPEGSFSFFHEDGDLFWGHMIEISGNLDDGLRHADIPG